MANTTNFGWETPDDTDLVKDGALAMRTLGNAIDTSLVDLKGGTTGQVLSKNTNADMDFTWITQNDADAIQNSIVDAKGDLISATADNTPARLASSGVNGDVLTVDTSTSTGLKWAAPASSTPTFVGCVLTKSSNQSISNNTEQSITFDGEEIDTDGFHSTVTNTDRITIPSGKAGKYLIIGSGSWVANATGQRQLYIRKNVSTALGNIYLDAAPSTGGQAASGSIIADLAVGDYLTIVAYQTSGNALNIEGAWSTKFSVQYLGA